MTAYVEGANAGNYHFTSSLPVQILKSLEPTLVPLIKATPNDEVVVLPNSIAVKQTETL
jgi:hypothetical protein